MNEIEMLNNATGADTAYQENELKKERESTKTNIKVKNNDNDP